MDILGDRRFVEVPGSRTHELPPLLVRMSPDVKRLDRVMAMANDLIEQEDILASPDLESVPENGIERVQSDFDHRRMDLALNLVEQYLGVIEHWQWGDSILEWIRQCETTFEARVDLRTLLRADVWPHAGRSSFVTLLEDKALGKTVDTNGIGIEKAVGMRLTFRQPPPLKCFSNQFLFYLNSPVANSAYNTWAGLTPSPICALPPERFSFNIVNMSLM